jgi:predicted DNA-binding transcriptional regulator YafY
MSAFKKFKRYMAIIEKVSGNRRHSFQDIKSYLEDLDMEISERTLQRDLEIIRNEFGIEIAYNRSQNHYFLDREKSSNTESFLQYLELASTADIFTEGISRNIESMEFISFDAQDRMQGVENIRKLLPAILERKKVKFAHINFAYDTRKDYKVNPYFLKQFQNRWYIFAQDDQSGEYRTFGLDRIENLQVLAQVFKRDKNMDPRQLFSEVIGLVYNDSEPCRIEFRADEINARYIRSLPLHSSQYLVKDEGKNGSVFSLYIRPNFEFFQRLLMFGESVEILSPKHIREEMKNRIKEMAKLYDVKSGK